MINIQQCYLESRSSYFILKCVVYFLNELMWEGTYLIGKKEVG